MVYYFYGNIDNPSYNITLGMCSECSPGAMCIFSDSDFEKEFIDSMQGGVTFKEYEDIYDAMVNEYLNTMILYVYQDRIIEI